MKSARRRAREFALQGLYQWLLVGTSVSEIVYQFRDEKEFAKGDQTYFNALLDGVVTHNKELEKKLTPHLDRPFKEISPIERGILLLASYELTHQPNVPFKVVINEAVELAKLFGGTDGHKFVNGVLDKLVLDLGLRTANSPKH